MEILPFYFLVLFAFTAVVVESTGHYEEGKKKYERVFEELWQPTLAMGFISIIGWLLSAAYPIFAITGIVVAAMILPTLALIYAGIRWLFAK